MQDYFVSVVVPIHNHARLLQLFLTDLQAVLEGHYADYEIILVDDASTDNTLEAMEDLLREFRCIRYLRLSRQFGARISDYAGMEAAIGDFVVLLSLEVDPVELIPALVDRATKNHGIVYGVCTSRQDETLAFRLVKMAFDQFTRYVLSMPFIREATQFVVFSRQALNSYLAIKDRFRHVRLFASYIGFTQEPFPYQQVRRCVNITSRSLVLEAGVGLHLIFANSTKPLRLMTISGILVAGANSVRALMSVGRRLIHGQPLDAIGLLDCQVAVLLFLLFMTIGVLAEYVRGLLYESQNRPLYYVQLEKSSSVLLRSSTRPNVVRA